MKNLIYLICLVVFFENFLYASENDLSHEENAVVQKTTIFFHAKDKLKVTADLYQIDKNKKNPLIILCHQAGWSRGEYNEIIPKLNHLGFNCLALDQRSGGAVNGVVNETFQRATQKKLPTTYLTAQKDIKAALDHCTADLGYEKVILWGSSYSASLVLKVASNHSEQVVGVLSFSPGEYFTQFGKPGNWIQNFSKKIKCPVFITSAKGEKRSWNAIYQALPNSSKEFFLPETAGNHGSRALWSQFKDHGEYWQAVQSFLKKNFLTEKSSS